MDEEEVISSQRPGRWNKGAVRGMGTDPLPATLVEAATLEHVREQQRRSATAWTEMAEAEEARAQSLRLPPPRKSA